MPDGAHYAGVIAAKAGQLAKSTVANPVVVMIETVWNTACRSGESLPSTACWMVYSLRKLLALYIASEYHLLKIITGNTARCRTKRIEKIKSD